MKGHEEMQQRLIGISVPGSVRVDPGQQLPIASTTNLHDPSFTLQVLHEMRFPAPIRR
jgi:predicted NBD/HSP70 family sugar kinase